MTPGALLLHLEIMGERTTEECETAAEKNAAAQS